MKAKASNRLTTLFVFAVIAFVVLTILGFKGCMVSDGYRDGVIQKFTSKGIVFSTWEGEMALEGYKRTEGGGSVWDFSVYDSDVAKTLQGVAPNSHIRLYYHQHRHVWPWQGSTAYEVYQMAEVSKEE